MYGPQQKWCFVPCCTSTSASTPNKIFVRVPQDYGRKKLWFAAARRDKPKSKSEFFCCEDHFKLEDDMENFVRFKLMGGKIIMKREVVPHIFECQPDRKRTATDNPARSLPVKRERVRLVAEALASAEYEQPFAGQPLALDTPSTSTAQMQEELEEVEEQVQQKNIGIQVRPSYRSKYVQCKLTATVQHSAVSPMHVFSKNIATSPLKVKKATTSLFEASNSSEKSSEKSYGGSQSSSFASNTSAASSDMNLDDKQEQQSQTQNVTQTSDESDEELSEEENPSDPVISPENNDAVIQTQSNRPVQNTFKNLQQANENSNQVKLKTYGNSQSASSAKSNKPTLEGQEFTKGHEQEDDSLYTFFISAYNAAKEMPKHVQCKIKDKITAIIEEEKLSNKNSSVLLEDCNLTDRIKIEEPSLDEHSSSGNEPYPEFIQKFETFVEKYEPL